MTEHHQPIKPPAHNQRAVVQTLALGFGTLIVLFILSLQGIDLSDHGYHLSQQYWILHPYDDLFDMSHLWMLTSLIGSAWLHLPGFPSLAWARFGWALVHTVTTLIAFSVVRRYHPPRRAAVVAFFVALFLAGAQVHTRTIEYFHLPGLFTTLAVAILAAVLERTATGVKVDSPAVRRMLSLGAAVALTVFARPTLAPLVVLPLALFLSPPWRTELKSPNGLRRLATLSGVYAAAGIVTAAAVMLVYHLAGVLPFFLRAISAALFSSGSVVEAAFTGERGVGAITWLLARRAARAALLTALFVLAVLAASLIHARARGSAGRRAVNALFVVGGIVAVALAARYLGTGRLVTLRRAFVWLPLGLITLMVIHRATDAWGGSAADILLITSWFVALVTPLASDTGLIKAAHGMWICLPLTLLAFGGDSAGRPLNRLMRSFAQLRVGVLVFFAYIALFALGQSIYRDTINRLELTTAFTHPSLSGVTSSPQRVRVVEEVLRQIDLHSAVTDEVLMVNAVAMIPYLSQRRPFFSNSWPFLEPYPRVQARLERAIASGRLPDLIVVGTTNTVDMFWPTDTGIIPKYRERLDLLQQLVIEPFAYRVVWSNDAFQLYRRDAYESTARN